VIFPASSGKFPLTSSVLRVTTVAADSLDPVALSISCSDSLARERSRVFFTRKTGGSGAVMPGVTVEAASPALIEKVRTVVMDGQGQFKIVDLRVQVNIVPRDGATYSRKP
jgi:hypothetical protein